MHSQNWRTNLPYLHAQGWLPVTLDTSLLIFMLSIQAHVDNSLSDL